MSWQYRVFHDTKRECFYIGEAYFDENGKCNGHTDEAIPWGETFDGLKWTIGKYMEALQKPVIECDKHEEARVE